MSNTLEINQNTLLKLVVRNGPDTDRQSVKLDVGELGFATDSNRLYCGNGVSLGGVLVGNTYLGSAASVTAISNQYAAVGDLAFSTDTQTLYRFKGGSYNTLGDWEAVGIVYSLADATLSAIGNSLKVGKLSAGNISQDALGRSLTIDTNRVTLSSTIAVNSIIPTSTSLTLPTKLSVNSLTYTLTASTLSANTVLTTDQNGLLSWEPMSTIVPIGSAYMTLGTGLTAIVDGNPTSETNLLTAANIAINGLFLPSAHVSFDQNMQITRGVRVASVSAYTGGMPTINGSLLIPSVSPYDSIGSTGAYEITLEDNFTSNTVVVDVRASNASYKFDNNGSVALSPTLNCYYVLGDSPYNKIYVFFYVPSTYISSNNGTTVMNSGPNYLTSGYSNARTLFNVTVYK